MASDRDRGSIHAAKQLVRSSLKANARARAAPSTISTLFIYLFTRILENDDNIYVPGRRDEAIKVYFFELETPPSEDKVCFLLDCRRNSGAVR